MLKWILTVAGTSFADLAAKHYVHSSYKIGEEKTAAQGNIVITRYENKGAMLGLLKDNQDVLKWLSAAGLGASAASLRSSVAHRRPWAEKLGMALLTGGAISNVGERTVRGCVTDYFRFPKAPKTLSKIVFNLGDIAIFAGIFLSIAGDIHSKIKNK